MPPLMRSCGISPTVVSAAAWLTLAACTSETSPVLPDNSQKQLRLQASLLEAPGCLRTRTASLTMCWNDKVVVKVATTSTNSDVQQEIERGVGRWNTLLSLAPFESKRTFLWAVGDTAGADVLFQVNGSETDREWCGRESGTRRFGFVLVRRGTVDCPISNSAGSIADVVAHELSLAIGWADVVEEYAVTGVSANRCASTHTVARAGLPLKSSVCYHDADGIIRLYNDTTVALGDWPLYWGTKILAEPDARLASDRVILGDSVAILAGVLRAGPFAEYDDAVSRGPGSYQALIVPAAAAVRSGAFLIGTATGTATVRLMPEAPSGYRIFAPLALHGVLKTLQVDPRPTLGFAVNRITPDTGAITVPGPLAVTAHIVSAPSAQVRTRWIVVDSRTPASADTTWMSGGTTWSTELPNGVSYSLLVTVRPEATIRVGTRDSVVVGGEYTQPIPICTGQALSGASALISAGGGGAGTDAVAGCTPVGGGGPVW
jgi:hypothetical protein